MSDWQSYLDIIREDDTPLLSSTRLLTTTTTTTTTETTTPTETDAPPAPLVVQPTPSVGKTGQQGHTPVQRVQSVKALPERAEPSHKVLIKPVLSPQPAADVIAPRRPASGGTGVPRWQEIDPHAYQPRPFGPMETDADWPGEDEEDEDAAPLPTTPAGTVAGATSPSPATPRRPASGATNRYPAGGTGRAAAPLSGEPFPDLEERCWLCEEEAELYDPSGQGWCSLCLAEAGKTEGWQDLVDLLPAAWRRKEEHQQLAVFAAAHYHQAGRREIAVRWSQPPFHQRLKGADLFRAFARWLAAPERWKQREAERLLERLVEHQGLGIWR